MNRTGLVLVAGALAISSACASAPVNPPVTWPDPPEVGRIRFVRAFRHTDDLRRSGFQRFMRSIFGPTRDPSMMQPMGLAVSEDGQRLYIGDPGIGHVLKVDLEDERISYFAPDEGMGKPFGVAVDSQENVYVANSAGAVVTVFSKDGERLRSIGQRELERPTGIAVDRKLGRVYIADSASLESINHRVRAYDLEGKFLFDLGPRDGKPARGNADGELYFPTFIAVAPNGNVYVADTMNFRIQVFDTEGKFVRKYGEHGDSAGFFSRIKGMAFDSFGNLYVVDGGHSNVQIFNPEFQVLLFFGGYARKLEYFDIPSCIAIEPNRNSIYVCNQFVARVNEYELINTTAEDSFPPPPPEKDAEDPANAAVEPKSP